MAEGSEKKFENENEREEKDCRNTARVGELLCSKHATFSFGAKNAGI